MAKPTSRIERFSPVFWAFRLPFFALAVMPLTSSFSGDRDVNIRRIGYVANLLSRNGLIVAVISPYPSLGDQGRTTAKEVAIAPTGDSRSVAIQYRLNLEH